jgi:hypothetical protein
VPGIAVIENRLRQHVRRFGSLLRAYVQYLLAGLVTVLLALLIVILIQFTETGDRLIVGNTGGSLSVLLEIGDERILVGAGPTRSHAADFVGRATRPWDGQIDLLVLPGWDDYHATGALGLMERRDVSGIVVVGLPGENPIWTLLEREAQRQDVPIRFIERAHQLGLVCDTELTLVDLSEVGQTGAWIRLEHQRARFDFVDAEEISSASPPSSVMQGSNEHIVVTMRSHEMPAQLTPVVAIRPQPFLSFEFSENDADFVANVPRNERVVVQLEDRQIRIPLDDLDFDQ